MCVYVRVCSYVTCACVCARARANTRARVYVRVCSCATYMCVNLSMVMCVCIWMCVCVCMCARARVCVRVCSNTTCKCVCVCMYGCVYMYVCMKGYMRVSDPVMRKKEKKKRDGTYCRYHTWYPRDFVYLFTFLLVLFCPGFDSGFESTEILLPSQTKTKRKGLGDVWIKGGGARVFVYVCVCVRAHTYFASKPNRK
jgi:hypothetical protein